MHAIADSYRVTGRALGSDPLVWSVTASLIDYLAPTPIAEPRELRARITEVKGRKARRRLQRPPGRP